MLAGIILVLAWRLRGVFRIGNGLGGVEAIVARLQGAGVVRVVLESIRGFSARLVRGSADAAKPPAMAP
jgi:hypothetical protein